MCNTTTHSTKQDNEEHCKNGFVSFSIVPLEIYFNSAEIIKNFDYQKLDNMIAPATVGKVEYYWYFYCNGGIEIQVKQF